MKNTQIVGPWRTATASGSNGNCVETAPLADGGMAVRDSKDQDGPALYFNRAEWTAFLDGAAKGEFDPEA